MDERKYLKGLKAEAFVSDSDRWALDKLKKVPLLPQLISKFYELGIDRWMYLMNMSMSVRCGPNQYPSLYNILHESCKVLDMPEPELYLTNNPFPNAWAGGIERPYITLRSSIVDNLSDEELYHLVGHELGHIKAEHILYINVAAVLFPLLEYVGRRTLGLGDAAYYGLIIAFYEWIRQAELSADRAGLLVAQDIDISVDANIALTAGPNRLRAEQSREEFINQARAYQDVGAIDQIGKALLWVLMGSTYTHPMPVHRVQELIKWTEGGNLQRILSGDYAGAPEPAGV